MGVYHLYADGSCHAGTRNGGWACVITDEELNCIAEFAAPCTDTTNNRMELLGVLEGLKKFDAATADVTVTSDSAYVINCFLAQWYVKWRKSGWITASGPVKNQDIWVELIAVVEAFRIPIKWIHIRGHKGNKWNERCDVLAGEARLTIENK